MLTASVRNNMIRLRRILTLLTVQLSSDLLRLLRNRIRKSRTHSTRRNTLRSHIHPVTRSSLLDGLHNVSVMSNSILLYRMLLSPIKCRIRRFITLRSNIRRRLSVLTRAASRIMRIRMYLRITHRRIENLSLVYQTSEYITRTRI